MLKIKLKTGRELNLSCDTCREALTLIAEIKKRSIPVMEVWYRNIDLNLSLECLHNIASDLLRRDNNVELGRRYIETISFININLN